jgi:hypothetical protein
MMRAATALLILAVTTVAAPSSGVAQVIHRAPDWVGSTSDEYERLMQLTGARPLSSQLLRPITLAPSDSMSAAAAGAAADPWGWVVRSVRRQDAAPQLELLGPSVRLVHNSAIPYGGNDAAMWAGRGTSGLIEAGARSSIGPLTLQLAPSFSWSENRAFEIGRIGNVPPGGSEFADAWMPHRIDRPQRFGEESFARADPGQSFVRVDYRGAALGASTANMWVGPGVETAILISSNAAGFPHAFLATSAPVPIWIGRLEAAYVLGYLEHSRFWRPESHGPRRWFGGIFAVLEPRGAPGLYLGGSRSFYAHVPEGGLRAGDLGMVFQSLEKRKLTTPENPSGNDAADQMLTLFVRWVFPSAGFEVFGEWARNDHSWDQRDFALEPDHSTARLWGFQKVFMQRSGFLLARGEFTNLETPRTAQLRAAPSWYTHHVVSQGFTQHGQVIGSWTGPGSARQAASADLFRGWGRVGVAVERVRHDTDAFYVRFGNAPRDEYPHARHHVTLGAGIRGAAHFGPATLSGGIMHAREYNRYSDFQNDLTNIRLDLKAELRGW